jgi:hypothetical protein
MMRVRAQAIVDRRNAKRQKATEVDNGRLVFDYCDRHAGP